ncbi:hypothetical protein Bca4012_102504 [Brassica carinata]
MSSARIEPPKRDLGLKEGVVTQPPIHGVIGLESSSTGSSFPADSAKPVPLAVVSLDSRQGHRIPLVRTSSELAVRRQCKAPERAVHIPSPGRHEAVRSRHVSGSSSPPTVDGFGTGTPEPSPQSQSFSRSYGSILPTSLAYIVPSTRGCSPWRPDAVMSTTGRGGTRSSGFSRARECTDNTRRAVLFQPLDPTSGGAVSRVGRLFNRKDNSFRIPPGVSGLPNVAVNRHVRFGILTGSPLKFAHKRYQTVSPTLRIDSPTSTSRTHATFPLFGLQRTHFNSCYYHQDLHRRPLRRARALGFAATAAPSYSSRPGSCPAAADFDFHDHRPAVLIDQHPLWVLATRPTYLKFENRSRALRPDASNHWLYPIELRFELQLSEETGGTSY